MRCWALLLSVASYAAPRPVLPGPDPSGLRVETHSIATGAELVTIFGRLPGLEPRQDGDIPLVSVLRDTLGDNDSENDRLRYVWVHTSARPTVLQKGAALIPFFYFRPDLGKNADKRPVPVIDLAATANPVFTTLAASLMQVVALDPEGMWVRSSTRSYRTDLGDLRRQQLSEALAVLRELQDRPNSALTNEDLAEMQVRLALADRPLGGLVSTEKLPRAYIQQRTRTEETRGHNWELLRQRAEANGLYFEPFGSSASPTHALLWISKADASEKRTFDSHFLNISNPYGDPRLQNWSGYTEQRYLNGEPAELIPLALYSFDYPKVPLLLADFRAAHAPKRREMMRRAANDTVSGVLGISKWGNWPYFAGSFTWNFVTTRHGAASNRAARTNAYSEVREWLELDPTLDPRLRAELQKRLELLSTNPLEISIAQEADIARRQYAALLKYAGDPQGLAVRLQHDRNMEALAYEHSFKATSMRTAHVVTFGAYLPQDRPSVAVMEVLDRARRVDRERRFLEQVAASGPQAEVVWNRDRIKQAVDELVANGLDDRSAQVVERIRLSTTDQETRDLCDHALESANVSGAGQ